MNSDKYILVTGGAGYIGSHTVVELYNNGFTPVIADDFRNSTSVIIEGLKLITGKELLIHRIDICDKQALTALFNQYQFYGIIHFAAYKAVGESVAEPLKYYHNNIGGLVNVLECALDFKVSHFVFSSSCTVYGDPGDQKEITESTPLVKANSPYGNTKLVGEQILQDLHVSGVPMKIISLRYFNPVGAHPSALIGEFPLGRPNNLLPFVTQTAIGKQDCLTVFGDDYPTSDGTCIRDYIHVCDLAEAHVQAIEYISTTNANSNVQVNIGTGKGTSVLELINAFEEVSGKKLNWKFGPRRPGDVTEIYANVDLAEKLLHWKSKFSMKEAVAHAWEWEKKLNENA